MTLDFGVHVAMTSILPIYQRKCDNSSRRVAFLILLSPRLQIDRQSALQTSQKEKQRENPFTLTCHIILKNFKLLRNGNDAGRIFFFSSNNRRQIGIFSRYRANLQFSFTSVKRIVSVCIFIGNKINDSCRV